MLKSLRLILYNPSSYLSNKFNWNYLLVWILFFILAFTLWLCNKFLIHLTRSYVKHWRVRFWVANSDLFHKVKYNNTDGLRQ